MLSSELAEVDALLASSGRPRLRAWRVQGADGKLSSFRSYIELSDTIQPVSSIIIEDASGDGHSTLHRKGSGPSGQKPIKAFLSYKWGSDAENAWVMNLASDLRGAGIDAILDRWEVRFGDSFTQCMTTKIQQPDEFLFIITTASVSSLEDPGYGGALKFEMQLASARRIAGESVRVVGIYREGNATPGYLRDHRYVDFREEAVYTLRLRELVDDLLDRIQPPPLGEVG